MGDVAIRVQGLGKQYRIGALQKMERTLREVITDIAGTPLRRARGLFRGEAYSAANLGEEIWALKDVSFEVKKGEILGIIGRNGAGKSTLLKILSRITQPTEGVIDLYGRVGALLEVGTGFHQELTGRENLYLNGAILGMGNREIDRKFDEIVDFSGVEKFIDTPVKYYSSGMRLRLGFAVAAHLEPDILIVDEVLAVGDIEFQKKCLGKMENVSGEGRTVLFVSHNLEAVNTLCSQGILLKDGRIETAGDVREVLDTYVSALSQQQPDSDLLPLVDKRTGIGLHSCDLTLEANPQSTSADLTVQVGIISEAPQKSVGIGFGISTIRGAQVIRYGAKITNHIFDVAPGVHYFTITCPGIGSILTAGDYITTVWLAIPGYETLVKLDNAGTFHIDGRDLYGTGYPLESHKHGPVILPMTIKLYEESRL